ncbi:MAG: hypothetical protein R3C32_04820 [Chloroflexota bacterium]
MLQEQPDGELVAQHERHVFPLLRERWRFAGSEGFRLLDAVHGDTLDEDVIAYANERRGSRSLVVYCNRYAEGRVRIRGVREALGLPEDPSAWVILRDQRSGLEFLRGCRDLATHGLELDLRAYQCHVFLDPSVEYDDAAADWARLAWRIGLGGVPDVRAALQDQLLEPTRLAVAALFDAQVVRDVAGAGLAPRDPVAETLLGHALETIRAPLAAVARAIGATPGRGASTDAVWDDMAARLRALVAIVRDGRRTGAARTDAAAVAGWLGADRARWTTVVSWAIGACLGDLVRASTPTATIGVFDAWAATSAVARCAGELHLDEQAIERVRRTVRGLLALPVGATTTLAGGDAAADASLAGWLALPAIEAATGWNDGRAWPTSRRSRSSCGSWPSVSATRSPAARRPWRSPRGWSSGCAADGFRAPTASSLPTPTITGTPPSGRPTRGGRRADGS